MFSVFLFRSLSMSRSLVIFYLFKIYFVCWVKNNCTLGCTHSVPVSFYQRVYMSWKRLTESGPISTGSSWAPRHLYVFVCITQTTLANNRISLAACWVTYWHLNLKVHLRQEKRICKTWLAVHLHIWSCCPGLSLFGLIVSLNIELVMLDNQCHEATVVGSMWLHKGLLWKGLVTRLNQVSELLNPFLYSCN